MRPLFATVMAFGSLAVASFVPTTALAEPDAAKVRIAAEDFDAGALAFKRKDYEMAASRFEAADATVPSAKTTRLAIRARFEAGHGSRAATLAAQALTRYPDDAETVKVSHDVLEKIEPIAHKVSVSCATPCVLAVGTRTIPGEARTQWVVYLDPGTAAMSASFSDTASLSHSTHSTRKDIDATAGGFSAVSFAAPPAVVAAPVPVVPVVEKPPADNGTRVRPSTDDSGSGMSPVVFVTGLVVSAGLGGVTIWSGVDTQSNPGPSAVRSACKGQGDECPEYQQGLNNEMRTNVLLGATIGTAVLTGVVGLFLTDWGGDPTPPLPGAPAGKRGSLRAVAFDPIAAAVGPHEAGLVVAGRFF